MALMATQRFVRIAPRKAREVADMVRGKDVETALALLRFTKKKAAALIAKALKSARANVENDEKTRHLADAELYIAKLTVDQGPTLKRIRPRAMGRAYRIRKHMSHIQVLLAARPPKVANAPRTRTARVRHTATPPAPAGGHEA